MLKFVIGAIIFGLIALAIIILVVINFSYKSLRQFRKTVEDQYELHQKRKEQKEKNPFGDDYFKSSDGQQTQQKRQRTGQQSLLFIQGEVDGDGYRYGSTYHRVVTHAEEAHHLYVSRN